jgi:hypothetical protein
VVDNLNVGLRDNANVDTKRAIPLQTQLLGWRLAQENPTWGSGASRVNCKSSASRSRPRASAGLRRACAQRQGGSHSSVVPCRSSRRAGQPLHEYTRRRRKSDRIGRPAAVPLFRVKVGSAPSKTLSTRSCLTPSRRLNNTAPLLDPRLSYRRHKTRQTRFELRDRHFGALRLV